MKEIEFKYVVLQYRVDEVPQFAKEFGHFRWYELFDDPFSAKRFIREKAEPGNYFIMPVIRILKRE